MTHRAQRTFHSSPIFRCNGRPKPWSCAETLIPTKTRLVDRPASYLERSLRPASGWRIERALDSHCGENDGGWEELMAMTRPCAGGRRTWLGQNISASLCWKKRIRSAGHRERGSMKRPCLQGRKVAGHISPGQMDGGSLGRGELQVPSPSDVIAR